MQMESTKTAWDGLRAIAVVRASDDKDGTASTAAQLDYMMKELDEQGMRFVGAEILDGVKASAPARIDEVLGRLFGRKRATDDFDVIAWMVEDRASRGGAKHGMWLEQEATRHGLRVYFPGDDGLPGPFKEALRALKYEAAKEESVNKGRRSAGGQTWAQKQGMFRTSGHTPFGCDRLYCGADNKPKFVIHNLPNGLQEQREWETGRLIGAYGTVGHKSRNRFKKQRNEYSLLVPGDRRHRKIVRVIFFLHYKRGWGGVRIASFLNRLNVAAPKGGAWTQRQVESIYENESYTGVSTNNRSFSGRFFKRDREHGFKALNRSETELVLKKTFTPRLRPAEEWERIDQPYMYDFLPKDVRDAAVSALARLWQDRADPARPPCQKKPRPRPASTFLLTDKLHALQDGANLSGTLSGPRDRTIPYYRHPRSREELKGSIYNRMIPAKPLHEELARVLAEVLGDVPDLRERLTRHVIEQREAADIDRPDATELEAEREELKAQITMILRSLSGAALADAKGELERLGARRMRSRRRWRRRGRSARRTSGRWIRWWRRRWQ